MNLLKRSGIILFRWGVLRAACLLTAAGLCFVACVSLETSAPPVTAAFPSASPPDQAQLQEGRHLYVTRCAKCHSVYPVTRYSYSEWEEIHARMAGKAKLASHEDAAVRAYVSTVLRMQNP